METKHQPATPLPWEVETTGDRYVEVMDSETLAITVCSVNEKPTRDRQMANAAYIVHAANAYPKLVETVRAALTWARENKQRAGTLNVEQMSTLLADLGEYDQ